MQANSSFIDISANQGHNKELSPYLMFKYAIKTEITRKHYETEDETMTLTERFRSEFFSLNNNCCEL